MPDAFRHLAIRSLFAIDFLFFVVRIFSYNKKRYENYFDENLFHANINIFA